MITGAASWPITKVMTHIRPHLDEIVALWLLVRFGGDRFLGIATAVLETVSKDGEERVRGQSEEELLAEETVCLGIGETDFEFDHHPHSKFPNDCTATLVAKFLGIDDDPALGQILEFTRENDLHGKGSLLDLAHIVGLLNSENPDDPQKIVELVFQVLDAKYAEQDRFFNEVKEQFDRDAEIFDINRGNGSITMVAVKSDEEGIAKYARSKHGAGAKVVILGHPNDGHVQIFTDKNAGIRLDDLVVALRLEEQRQKGGGVALTDWRVLREDGTLSQIPEWFFFREANSLMNGSKTAPEVPATKIPFDRIVELTKMVLDLSHFAEECPPVGCIGSDCSLFRFGLHRCRKIRFDVHHAQNA